MSDGPTTNFESCLFYLMCCHVAAWQSIYSTGDTADAPTYMNDIINNMSNCWNEITDPPYTG